MRYSGTSPGGAWPADMTLSVEQPATLWMLLFVRSAWKLDANGVPWLDEQPWPGSTTAPVGLRMAEANQRWTADWARAFEAVAPPRGSIREPDDRTRRVLDADLSAEELARAVSTETFWRTGLDVDAEWAWRLAATPRVSPGSLGPEHDAVDWLVPLWRAGLRSIIELPFAGYHVRLVDREHLVVSRVTRRDPELYSLALSTI